ncbi:MAG: DegT/DnrJ/EryC1/StrS family aminotransferase [Armatimonadetes bacterium]|nr:DegT/DnrJ/EryC1/StrS family aminotransferase [Armatimonadota bacterium]
MKTESKTIPLSQPYLEGPGYWRIQACLESGDVSAQGTFLSEFAERICAATGARHCVLVASGTAALHLILRVAGIGPGDEVLVPSLTFIASANVVTYVGATPVFLDVDPATSCLDVQSLRSFLGDHCERREGSTWNLRTGRRIRAVMPVHLYGHPVDMEPLRMLSQEHGLFSVEDATEALGASYRGASVGTLGDAAALSFNGNKLITTGSGGAVLTDDPAFAERVRHLSTQARVPGIDYRHDEVGYNYRMTNLQAALGCSQIENLSWRLAKKRAIADQYRAELDGLSGLEFCEEATWAQSAYWLSCARVRNGAPLSARELTDALRARGMMARPFFMPLHTLPPFSTCPAVDVGDAVRAYEEGVCLPSHLGLAQDDIRAVTSAIRELWRR